MKMNFNQHDAFEHRGVAVRMATRISLFLGKVPFNLNFGHVATLLH